MIIMEQEMTCLGGLVQIVFDDQLLLPHDGIFFSPGIFIVLMMSWRSWKIFRGRNVTLGATIDCSMPAGRIPLGASL